MTQKILQALNGKLSGTPPIWIMRQAGRYMPEYRALREKHTFLQLCHQPELIAKVTELPIKAFGMDAAILFSDILVIPEALDVGLRFEDAIGPIIERPLVQGESLKHLHGQSMKERLQYVTEGIKILKSSLKVPLIGFCGAPFTLASYMIEGKSSRMLSKTKKWMWQDPVSFHALLNRLTDCAIEFLHMQIEAGVEVVQVFESWASFLGFSQFKEFSLMYLEKIIKSIKPKVPVILFCKGASSFIQEIAAISPSGISVDWSVDLASLRSRVPQSIALQGNLDPDVLHAAPSVIRKEAKGILNAMRHDPAYIFNLGHGIAPDTPVDAVKVLVDCVHER